MIDEIYGFIKTELGKNQNFSDPANIFEEKLPLDFLKDNDYAALICLIPTGMDRKRQGLKTEFNEVANEHVYTEQIYEREVTARVFIYAPRVSVTRLVEGLQDGFALAEWIGAGLDKIRVKLENVVKNSGGKSRPDDERRGESVAAILRITFTGNINKEYRTGPVEAMDLATTYQRST